VGERRQRSATRPAPAQRDHTGESAPVGPSRVENTEVWCAPSDWRTRKRIARLWRPDLLFNCAAPSCSRGHERIAAQCSDPASAGRQRCSPGSERGSPSTQSPPPSSRSMKVFGGEHQRFPPGAHRPIWHQASCRTDRPGCAAAPPPAGHSAKSRLPRILRLLSR